MSRIGRSRLTVFDLIDLQVKKSSKAVDLEKLKRQVNVLQGKLTDSLTILSDSSAGSASGNEATYGYDYTTVPPVMKLYPNITSRFDNLDMALITLPETMGDALELGYAVEARVVVVEGQVTDISGSIDDLQARVGALEVIVEDLQNATLTIVQYIPDDYITSIVMPDRIEVCRVYRNGLRLFEGGGYDYTFTNDTISVEGNAGDRFIIEYNPIPWS
jgi:hypothetical protein